MSKKQEPVASMLKQAKGESPERTELTRREVLQGAGALGVSVGVAACASDDEGDGGGNLPEGDAGAGDGGPGLEPDGFPAYRFDGEVGPEDLFQHGAASGDPLPDAVILWTRVTQAGAEPVSVWWEIATDTAFERRVNVGTADATADRDFTVKVDAEGLEPGTTYYYRFFALGRQSPVARTRTAPTGAVPRLRLALVSCSSYAHGYFHAYDKVAARLDLDAVVHLGDYVYEYGSTEYGDVRPYEPEHEALTLADYRTRHSYYKRDASLQAVHKQHVFICVWDDHETANNAFKDGAENHTPDTEGPWADRKAAGLKAYFEWMPIREVGGDRIWRKFEFGDLMDLVMLDTRLWGRNRQDLGIIGPIPEPDPGRTLLGDDQAAWMEEQLTSSAARWKLVGQQVMVGNMILEPGVTLANLDQWHGYPESRERLISFLEARKPENLVFLTGDIHSSWANEVVRDPNDPADYDPLTGEGSLAVEFVTPAVTSIGLDDFQDLIDTSRVFNPQVRYLDPSKRGYVILDVQPDKVQGVWYHLDSILEPGGATESVATVWSVATGTTRLVEEAAPIAAPTEVPAAAP